MKQQQQQKIVIKLVVVLISWGYDVGLDSDCEDRLEIIWKDWCPNPTKWVNYRIILSK